MRIAIFNPLPASACVENRYQKKESEKQSTSIAAIASGFAELGFPLMAVSFNKLHQKLFAQLKPIA
jgi:hypothetical protein